MAAFILCCLASVAASAQSATYLRQLLDDAARSGDAARRFLRETRSISDTDEALLNGFRAMADLLMCRYVFLPSSKWQHFVKGRDQLEAAIRRDPVNAELRFMRFCTQVNTPALLGYKSSINTDKRMLIRYLQDQSQIGNDTAALNRSMKAYLLQSNICETSEIKLLKTL
ncbi:MAG: hypothetical protein QM743_13300 [Chitinophagaceae bacterium]